MPKKFILDLVIERNQALRPDLLWLCLTRADGEPMPEMTAGQFVELRIPTSGALLNRPISVFDCHDGVLELLVKVVGTSTTALAQCRPGDALQAVAPLGRPFSMEGRRPLLLGGGVGIAPMYCLAKAYAARGIRAQLVYGERTTPPAALLDHLAEVADLHLCTDDGSAGFHGLVTAHPICSEGGFDIVQTCGPLPMMRAVASMAAAAGVECEVSLENKMACGLGACLCCVEDTTTGRRCVCSDGPVFNTKELTWQI